MLPATPSEMPEPRANHKWDLVPTVATTNKKSSELTMKAINSVPISAVTNFEILLIHLSPLISCNAYRFRLSALKQRHRDPFRESHFLKENWNHSLPTRCLLVQCGSHASDWRTDRLSGKSPRHFRHLLRVPLP